MRFEIADGPQDHSVLLVDLTIRDGSRVRVGGIDVARPPVVSALRRNAMDGVVRAIRHGHRVAPRTAFTRSGTTVPAGVRRQDGEAIRGTLDFTRRHLKVETGRRALLI